MKKTFALLLTLIAICLAVPSCATHRDAAPTASWETRVADWLPIGTPISKAREALTDNGFRWVGDSSVATATLRQGKEEVSVVMGFAQGKLISQTTAVTPVSGL